MASYCEHCGSVLEQQFGNRTLGDLSIVQGSRELWCNDKAISIPPIEEGIIFDLLSGKPLTKEAAVMRHAKSEDTNSKTTDVYISRIRGRLETLGSICKINTLWGLGWQMAASEPEFEQRAFGDAIFDFDRRLVLKGEKFVPVFPQVLEVLRILISGNLEPTEKLQAVLCGESERNKQPKLCQAIHRARGALAQVGSKIEIQTFERRGYRMTA